MVYSGLEYLPNAQDPLPERHEAWGYLLGVLIGRAWPVSRPF
jgi:hypothetical protein